MPKADPAPAGKQAEAEQEQAERIATAQGLWNASKTLAGTVAERYVMEARGIPRPVGDWPDAVRFHAESTSLIVAGTDADGAVQFVQRVFLTMNGTQIPGRVKQINGVMDGAFVRLPGPADGPLLLAEGPETGLAVWAATGAETWLSIGSMTRNDLPPTRRVVLCANDDVRRPAQGKSTNAFTALKRALADWKARGFDVTSAYPWSIRRFDQSDFNDVIQAGGVKAVRLRIEFALNPPWSAVERVPVTVARVKLAEAVDGFRAKARAWVTPDPDNINPPPVDAIRVDVGAGKSAAARLGLVRHVVELQTADKHRNVAIAVPTHTLGDEQAELAMMLTEAKQAGLTAHVWRGRGAVDPDHPDANDATIPAEQKTKMCLDLDAVADAQSIGAVVQLSVCRRRLENGKTAVCNFNNICGYQELRKTEANLWVIPHELLFTKKPRNIGELALVVIDESFWQAGLINEASFPVDLLERPAAVPDDKSTKRLRGVRRLTLKVLRDHEIGPILRDRIIKSGLTVKSFTDAREIELMRKIKVDLVPGMSSAARKDAIAKATINKEVLQLAAFWRSLEALLADDGPEASGWVRLDHDANGARVAVLKGHRPIHEDWQVPMLVADANLTMDLIRPYLPQARMVADVKLSTPHMRVRQVIDRTYAKNMLAPLDNEEAKAKSEEARRRANHLTDLRTRLICEARLKAPGKVLVMMQKSVEAAMLALGPLPANVETAHHNAIAGRDEWRNVALIVVVGRTMPPPLSVTRMAEALSGAALPVYGDWHERTDAIRETLTGAVAAEADRHSDPLAEAVRWEVCEGELVQIIGRGRGADRTANNPLDVLVLTDVPLPLPVAETLTAESVRPTLAERMFAAGGVVLNGAGDAARAYPWMGPIATAKKAFQRERSGTFPYNESPIGECLLPLTRVTYQLAGAGRKSATAWIDPLQIADPAAWLVERLGPLVSCDGVHQPAALAGKPVTAVPVGGEAVMPSAPAPVVVSTVEPVLEAEVEAPMDLAPPEVTGVSSLSWERDLFEPVEAPNLDDMAWSGGPMPDPVRKAIRWHMRDFTQDNLSRLFGISRPQLANAIQGRFDASPTAAARILGVMQALQTGA